MASKKESKQLDVEALCVDLRGKHAAEGWTSAKQWFEVEFPNDLIGRIKFLDAVMYADAPFVHDGTAETQPFTILQGDIFRSTLVKVPDPVHPFDESSPSFYAVLHPSCSIQPKRHRWVLTSRLIPVGGDDGNTKGLLKDALTFKSAKFFFLPPLPDQPEQYIGNLACFEEVAYIENGALQLVDRVASLSEVGWHLFNAFLVHSFTRSSADDLRIRAKSYPKKVSIG